MRKNRHWLLTMVMLLCSITGSAHDFEVDGIYYNIVSETDLTVEVTYKGSSSGDYADFYVGDVVLPSVVEYNGDTYNVVRIGDNAFEACWSLSSIGIPENITTIGSAAFAACAGLSEITIPLSVTSIGSNVFANCASLTSIIVDENNPVYDSRNNCNAIIETATNTLVAGGACSLIPESVTAIGDYAFNCCEGLTAITLPSSITSIGEYAFNLCANLESVVSLNISAPTLGNSAFAEISSSAVLTIPCVATTSYEETGWISYFSSVKISGTCGEKLTWILDEATGVLTISGEGEMYDYNHLTEDQSPWKDYSIKEVIVEEGVTSIGGGAFAALYYSECDVASVSLPEGLESIGGAAFSGCSLSEINFPSTLNSIGGEAFGYCSSLEEIYIPASVESVAGNSFYGVTLTSIVVDGENTVYDSREECNGIIETATNKLILGCTNTTIPEGVEVIAEFAFTASWDSEKVLSIPSSVTSIEGLAFYHGMTSSLKEVVCYATTPPVLGESAFCLSADNIPTLRVSASSVAAYQTTDGWKEFYIEPIGGVTNGFTFAVGGFTFNVLSVEEMTVEITAGPSVSSLTIPATVTYSGYEFQVVAIAEHAFRGNEVVESVSFSEGLVSIGANAFNGCVSLCQMDSFPASIKSIGVGAFHGCTSLESFNFPNGVSLINHAVLGECTSLTTIHIPKSITSIDLEGEGAFYMCESLTSITCEVEEPINITTIEGGSCEVFYGVDKSLCTLYVLPSSVEAYKAAEGWKEFNIEPIGGVTDGFSFVVDDFTFKVLSVTDMTVEVTAGPSVSSLAIPATAIYSGYEFQVKSIAENAFMSNEVIESVSFPEGLVSIGMEAFSGCNNLTSSEFPASLKSIGNSAFAGTSLTTIQFSGNDIVIGESAFASTKIENVNLVGVVELGSFCFFACYELTSISIPNTIAKIGDGTFSWCKNLNTMIVEDGNLKYDSRDNCNAIIETESNTLLRGCSTTIIPDDVVAIGDYAYNGYSGLTSIVIPEGVTSIGVNGFKACFDLEEITLPSTLSSIGDGAFSQNTALTSLTCLSVTPPELESSLESPFEYINKEQCTLYVLLSSVSTYTEAGWGNYFGSIVGIEEDVVEDYPNILTIDNMTVRAGEQVVLSVGLDNVVDITSFQFDLVLPEGITIAQDEDGYELIDLSEERTTLRKHIVTGETQADGAIRVVCYSVTNAVFSGTEGEVLTITLNVSESISEGDYTILLNGLVLTEYTDGNPIKHTVPSVESVISVYIPGDVNGDAEIDVTDISGVVNFILNTSSSAQLNQMAADVNDDGDVDVVDVSGVVNLILNTSTTTMSARNMQRTSATSDNNDTKLTVLPFTLSAGEEKEIEVLLDNPGDAFTGVQFDLYLPEGVSVVYGDGYYYVDLGSRTTNRKHVLPECKVQSDGAFRVLCYSNDNATFNDESGDVLVITVVGDDNLASGVYELGLNNIVLSRPDVTKYEPVDYTASILSGDGGAATSFVLSGIYPLYVLKEFSTALADNISVTNIDLTSSIEVDNTATLTTGNPNTIVYLAEGDALANESNVVSGEECANLVLTDGYAFSASVPFNASQASYERELAAGKYGTIVLPYAPNTDDYVFYALTSATDNMLTFDEVTNPVANTPYLYKLRDGKSATQITNSEVAVSSELTSVGTPVWQMVGSFTNQTIVAGEDEENSYYVYTSSDNQVHQVTNTLTVKPYRAYFTTSSANNMQLAVRTRGGEETLIDASEVDGLCPEVYYDLSGRRVDNPTKGVYIVNGKKVVL